MLIYLKLVFIFISIVHGGNDEDPTLRLYHKSSNDSIEVSLNNATGICSIPWFNSTRDTLFLCHGFKGTPEGPCMTILVEACLNKGGFNVIVINWSARAADKFNNIPLSYALWGVPNSMKLASDFAEALLRLFKACLDINKIRILGHSLGAHAMGATGIILRKKGLKVPWITGLDPAGAFDNVLPETRLNSDSAILVDVIHCDFFKYGSLRRMGRYDFWPNFYGDQPGCNHSLSYEWFSNEDLCNHNRCCQLMAEALQECPGNIIGCFAKNYEAWKNSREEERNITLEWGTYDLEAPCGDYFLTTNADPPYGRGRNGVNPT